MSDKVMCILKFAEMLANVGKFVGLLAVSGLTALAVFLRYYHNKRTGVKSVAVDTEVIYSLTYVLTAHQTLANK